MPILGNNGQETAGELFQVDADHRDIPHRILTERCNTLACDYDLEFRRAAFVLLDDQRCYECASRKLLVGDAEVPDVGLQVGISYLRWNVAVQG